MSIINIFWKSGFFLMFHLPELVEDICFQSLNEVSLFPAPLFNQWFTLRTHHQNHYSLATSSHLHYSRDSKQPVTSSIPSSPFLRNFQWVVTPLPSFITKDTILRKHSPRTKSSSKTVVSPTTLGSFLPFKRKYRIGNELSPLLLPCLERSSIKSWKWSML